MRIGADAALVVRGAGVQLEGLDLEGALVSFLLFFLSLDPHIKTIWRCGARVVEAAALCLTINRCWLQEAAQGPFPKSTAVLE